MTESFLSAGQVLGMEKLGIIEEITCDGRIIVRCSNLPEIGDAVFFRNERIGSVGRIFGPVDEPYVSVSPVGKARADKGGMTFFTGRKRDAKDKRRNRRD